MFLLKFRTTTGTDDIIGKYVRFEYRCKTKEEAEEWKEKRCSGAIDVQILEVSDSLWKCVSCLNDFIDVELKDSKCPGCRYKEIQDDKRATDANE